MVIPVTHIKKLIISKCVLIKEYQNQLREFYYKNIHLVSMSSFNYNEGIKGVFFESQDCSLVTL